MEENMSVSTMGLGVPRRQGRVFHLVFPVPTSCLPKIGGRSSVNVC